MAFVANPNTQQSRLPLIDKIFINRPVTPPMLQKPVDRQLTFTAESFIENLSTSAPNFTPMDKKFNATGSYGII